MPALLGIGHRRRDLGDERRRGGFRRLLTDCRFPRCGLLAGLLDLRGGTALGLFDFGLRRGHRLLLLSGKLLTQALLDLGETPAFLFRDLVTDALEFGAADF